jgi:hypothetical protein
MKILLTYKGRGKDVGRSVGRSVGFPDWFGKIEVWFCPILNIVTRFNNVYAINIDSLAPTAKWRLSLISLECTSGRF